MPDMDHIEIRSPMSFKSPTPSEEITDDVSRSVEGGASGAADAVTECEPCGGGASGAANAVTSNNADPSDSFLGCLSCDMSGARAPRFPCKTAGYERCDVMWREVMWRDEM